MHIVDKYKNDVQQLLWLVLIFLCARLAFIAWMTATYSKDLYAWLNVVDVLQQGQNPYVATGVLNWPPFWMQVLYFANTLHKATGLSLIHVIQTVLMLGEVLTMVIAYFLLKDFCSYKRPNRILIPAIALNPICILLTCQHCNFDVYVGVWVLLFVYALSDFHQNGNVIGWLMACFFLGMGILTKTVPFVLFPILLVRIKPIDVRTKVFGAVLLLTPILIGMSIVYTLSPPDIKAKVLNYRSMSGWHGITGLMALAKQYDAIYAYRNIYSYLIIGFVLFMAWSLHRLKELQPRHIMATVLIIVLSIPTLGTGYSPPYILWYLPLLAVYYALCDNRLQWLIVAGYVITAATYITEYAFFNSHGSFMTHFVPTEKMQALSEYLGAGSQQIVIRIPIFVYHTFLLVLLFRSRLVMGKDENRA